VGLRRTFRAAPAELEATTQAEPLLDVDELDALLDDFQERLFRITATDVRPELKAKFESPSTLKVTQRLRDGKVIGAALASVEGRSADLTFLHMLPKFATVDASARLLDATLAAMPPSVAKVRAMGSHSGRWLHIVGPDARRLLLDRRFASFDRALMARDLRIAPAVARPLPPGFTVEVPDPAQVEEHAGFAYRAYRGTTDFGVIALEETPEAYARLYRRFLSGEFGVYARDLSVLVRSPEGATAAVLHTIVLLGEPYVGDLSVLPEYRRHGMGRALLLRGMARYRDAGYRRVGLTVTVQNTPALNLYRSVGFEIERSTELFLLVR